MLVPHTAINTTLIFPLPLWLCTMCIFCRGLVVRMGAEVGHADIVRLIEWGPGHRQTLWHQGTGERVHLGGSWVLQFEGPMGQLRRLGANDAELKWVNDVFDWSMHVTPMVAERKLFYFSKLSGKSLTHKSLSGELQAKVFRHSTIEGAFKAEVYEHRLPAAGTKWRRFWTCPFVQAWVFGEECHNRWACRHFASWVRTLRSFSNANAEHVTEGPMTA